MIAQLHNKIVIAKLAWRYPQFSRAIAARRLSEIAYTLFPRLPGVFPCPKPLEVVIALTSKCQLKCAMCGIRKVMAKPEFKNSQINPDALVPLLDEIAGWTLKPYVKLTGGEPLLLQAKLIKLVQECQRRGIPTRLSTNGCLLSRKGLAFDLVHSGLDILTISLDGPREVHNSIRGSKRAFDQTIQGIENIAKAKELADSVSPLLQISTVIHAHNQHHLKGLFALLRPLPIQWWNLQLLNFISPESSQEADSLAREWDYPRGPWSLFMNESLCEIDAQALAHDIRWIEGQHTPFAKSILRIGNYDFQRLSDYYYHGKKVLKQKICIAPFISLHIVPNGDMVFCIDYPYVSYGNIRNGSVEKAWLSEGALRFRRRVLDYYFRTGRTLPQCNRCNWMFN